MKINFKNAIVFGAKALTSLKKFFVKTGQLFATVFVLITNNRHKKLISTIIFSFLIFVAFAHVVFGVLIYGFKLDNKATKLAAAIMPYPAAIVNYDFVTYKDLLHEEKYIHKFYQSTQQDNVDFTEIDQQVYDQLIENKLVASLALVNKVSVSKKDVDQAVNGVIEQNGGTDKVEKVLSDLYGLTLNEFRELVRIQLLRDKLNEKVIAKVTVQHILIRVDKDAPADKVNEAKAKIDGIRTEITNGLDFGEAAKKYSEDIGSASDGGILEPFAKGEMVDEFSNAAFETKTGEISQPIRTEFGWHIIKVQSRQGKIEMKFTDWIGSIKKKSLIVKLYAI